MNNLTVTKPAEKRDPNFSIFAASGDYERYFALVRRAGSLLLKWYKLRASRAQTSGDTFEHEVVGSMLERFLYTGEALRMKYTYGNPEFPDSMRIDLTDSGFPNAREIQTIPVDLDLREQTLRDLMPEKTLKNELVTQLLQLGVDPPDILHQLSQRTYLNMLDQDKLFLPFVPGPLKEWRERKEKGVRGYVHGWSCYGQEKNCPYISLMIFDQDEAKTPLDQESGERAQFNEVIKTYGSQISPMLVLATDIDEHLASIHPKLLKRIRIGPLYSPLLLKERDQTELFDDEKLFTDLFAAYGDGDDFVLMVSEEIIFSAGQEKESGFARYFVPKQVREIFHIPPTSREAYEAGTSLINYYILMPYRILQNISRSDVTRLPRLARCGKIGYDKKEMIHEIS